MTKPNKIEKEIHDIRNKLQNQEKSLTIEESTIQTNKLARKLAKEFGFELNNKAALTTLSKKNLLM